MPIPRSIEEFLGGQHVAYSVTHHRPAYERSELLRFPEAYVGSHRPNEVREMAPHPPSLLVHFRKASAGFR
jgi:hypothetical protein